MQIQRILEQGIPRTQESVINMPRVFLSEKQRQEQKIRNFATRIIRCLPQNYKVAEALGNTQQKQRYRTQEIYPVIIPELIKILDLAGYEIKEKDF